MGLPVWSWDSGVRLGRPLGSQSVPRKGAQDGAGVGLGAGAGEGTGLGAGDGPGVGNEMLAGEGRLVDPLGPPEG